MCRSYFQAYVGTAFRLCPHHGYDTRTDFNCANPTAPSSLMIYGYLRIREYELH